MTCALELVLYIRLFNDQKQFLVVNVALEPFCVFTVGTSLQTGKRDNKY